MCLYTELPRIRDRGWNRYCDCYLYDKTHKIFLFLFVYFRCYSFCENGKSREFCSALTKGRSAGTAKVCALFSRYKYTIPLREHTTSFCNFIQKTSDMRTKVKKRSERKLNINMPYCAVCRCRCELCGWLAVVIYCCIDWIFVHNSHCTCNNDNNKNKNKVFLYFACVCERIVRDVDTMSGYIWWLDAYICAPIDAQVLLY